MTKLDINLGHCSCMQQRGYRSRLHVFGPEAIHLTASPGLKFAVHTATIPIPYVDLALMLRLELVDVEVYVGWSKSCQPRTSVAGELNARSQDEIGFEPV
eukprot:1337648-Amorphochlora_amoeboformis.AAC.1